MSDNGWAVLFVMAFLIMSSAPEALSLGLLVLIGCWIIGGTRRALRRGEDPRTISRMVDDLFDKRKDR